MKFLPIQAQVAIGLVVVLIIFGAGWKIASWKSSEKIATLTGERDAAILERDEKRAFADACAVDLASINADLIAMNVQREMLQAAYDDAIRKTPEVVIRYRDRWHSAENEITSEDCPTAVGELVTFLQTLPGLQPEGGAP